MMTMTITTKMMMTTTITVVVVEEVALFLPAWALTAPLAFGLFPAALDSAAAEVAVGAEADIPTIPTTPRRPAPQRQP